MADTQTNAAAPAETMFSPDDAIETLWVKSFDGEVLGEVLFARMAEQFDDPDHRHKMQVLSTLERRTKEMMVAPLERAGLSTEPAAKTIAEAESLAEALTGVAWADFIGSFEPITSQYAAMYARIGELNPDEQANADLLVAHELALRDFGRLELDGKVDDSLAAITALPHLQ
jgi:hypothetical protein